MSWQRLSFKPLDVFCPWGNQSVLMAPQLNQKDCHKSKKKKRMGVPKGKAMNCTAQCEEQ